MAPKTAYRPKMRNAYKEALLNPMSGPLVGVPVTVPVDTHRCRLKAAGTITVTGGALTVIGNPNMMLCNDSIAATGGNGFVYPINYIGATSLTVSNPGILSNAQYTRAQFAGLTTGSSVRGRIVGCSMRICNTSALNTRNGVFTTFHDPQHNTLQAKTASNVASDTKARQYNAGTDLWHNVTYHPVEPEEVDGWIWDPLTGPQGGVKTGSYGYAVPGTGSDATSADLYPGYMGIWWNGDAVSQTFQVEMYAIVEYVGSLVQPLVRPIGSDVDDAQEARDAAENTTSHVSTPGEGNDHTGHPESETHPSRARRALDLAEHALHNPAVQGGIRKAGRMAAVTAAGYFGGPAAARAASQMLLSPEQTAQYTRGLTVASDYMKDRRARSASAVRSAYTTPRGQLTRGRSTTRR